MFFVNMNISDDFGEWETHGFDLVGDKGLQNACFKRMEGTRQVHVLIRTVLFLFREVLASPVT